MTLQDDLPEGVDTPEELDLEDVETYSPEVLNDVLEDVAQAQFGEEISVEFADRSAADGDRDVIYINPRSPILMGAESLENQLRLLTNTLNHEIEHFKSSDLDSKRDFVQEWEGWGELPGLLINIIEDRYIDCKRQRDYPGLKRTMAFARKQYVEGMPPVTEIDSERAAAVVGLSLYYSSGGSVKGYDGASGDVQQAIDEMVSITDGLPYTHDEEERWEMAEDCMAVMERIFGTPPSPPKLPERVADLLTSSTAGGEPAEAPELSAEKKKRERKREESWYGGLPRPIQYLVIFLLVLLSPLLWLLKKLWELLSSDSDTSATKWGVPVKQAGSGEEIGGEDDGETVEAKIKQDTGLVDGELDGDTKRGGGDTDDLDEPETVAARRAQSLREEVIEYDPELAERKQERERRIDEYRSRLPDDELSESVRRDCRESGVLGDIERTFESLLSQEGVRSAPRGRRISSNNVVRRAAGDMTQTDLFEQDVVMDTGDRVVGVATDVSGSMEGDIHECKMAIASIAKAVELCNDTFVATAFTDDPSYHGEVPEAFDLRLMTGPTESFEWEHLDQFSHERNEPTAAAIYDMWSLMQRVAAEDYLMLVITDGAATVTLDGESLGRQNARAIEDVAEAADDVRPDCTVLGVGIGSVTEEDMRRSFGPDSYVMTSIDTLADDLVELLLDDVSLKRL